MWVWNLRLQLTFFLVGHTFSHFLQLIHFFLSIIGYQNPSSSKIIFIHEFGHACAHAEHPQQSSFNILSNK